jgi:hypothetical protein
VVSHEVTGFDLILVQIHRRPVRSMSTFRTTCIRIIFKEETDVLCELFRFGSLLFVKFYFAINASVVVRCVWAEGLIVLVCEKENEIKLSEFTLTMSAKTQNCNIDGDKIKQDSDGYNLRVC